MSPQRETRYSRIALALIAFALLLCGAFGLQTEASYAFAYTTLHPTPMLSVSPSSIAPGGANCTSHGSSYQCTVQLSGSNILPNSPIHWFASASVSVNPSSGWLYSDSSVPVTISGLPCAHETITFSGTSSGKPVPSVSVEWNCTPPPPPTHTPTPRPRPTPTAGVTPTAANTSVPPTPTKVLTATPTPTATAANNSGGITGVGPFHPGGPGGGSGFPLGNALTIAALLLGLLAFLLYLLPRPGVPGSVFGKLRSLIIPDSLLRR